MNVKLECNSIAKEVKILHIWVWKAFEFRESVVISVVDSIIEKGNANAQYKINYNCTQNHNLLHNDLIILASRQQTNQKANRIGRVLTFGWLIGGNKKCDDNNSTRFKTKIRETSFDVMIIPFAVHLWAAPSQMRMMTYDLIAHLHTLCISLGEVIWKATFLPNSWLFCLLFF